MKRSFVVLMAFLVILSTGLVFAQKSAVRSDSSISQAMTPEEAKKIRESVIALGELFGVNQNSQQQNQQPVQQQNQQQGSGKTVADVADKALDLLAKGITTIAENLEKTAPFVWKVMIKQQYANAIANLIVPWSLFFGVVTYMSISRKMFKKSDREIDGKIDWDSGRVWVVSAIPTILLIIFGTWGFNRLSDSIQLLINPEYYAIRDLLRMIMSGGKTF
ncbi:MAG: hypothetical protein WCV80_01120 [Candidatus Paceibacterota bacterium]|jgi:hypothetical protein